MSSHSNTARSLIPIENKQHNHTTYNLNDDKDWRRVVAAVDQWEKNQQKLEQQSSSSEIKRNTSADVDVISPMQSTLPLFRAAIEQTRILFSSNPGGGIKRKKEKKIKINGHSRLTGYTLFFKEELKKVPVVNAKNARDSNEKRFKILADAWKLLEEVHKQFYRDRAQMMNTSNGFPTILPSKKSKKKAKTISSENDTTTTTRTINNFMVDAASSHDIGDSKSAASTN
jgi:hypothetical protein